MQLLNTNRFSYIHFVFLCIIYFFNVLVRNIFGPLAPIIAENLNLSSLEIGNIFLIISFGFGVSLFLTQFISMYLTYSQMIALSSFFSGLALVGINFCTSWVYAKFFLSFIGVGCGLFLPCAMGLIVNTIESKNLGKAFGVFTIFQGLGFIIAPIILQILLKFFTWKELLFFLGNISIVIGTFYFSISEVYKNKTEKLNVSYFLKTYSNPSFWIFLLLFASVTGLNVGIYNLVPHYFSSYGVQRTVIHSYLVVGRILSLFFAFGGGWLADRYGIKKALSLGFILSGFLTFLMGAVFVIDVGLLLWCLQTPVTVCITPIIQSALSKVFPKKNNASVVGMISSLSFFFGSGIIPQFLTVFSALNIYFVGFMIFGLIGVSVGLFIRREVVYKYLES